MFDLHDKLERGEKLTREEKNYIADRLYGAGGQNNGSTYRLGGWSANFSDLLPHFLVKADYFGWYEYVAPDRTSLRHALGERYVEAVDYPQAKQGEGPGFEERFSRLMDEAIAYLAGVLDKRGDEYGITDPDMPDEDMEAEYGHLAFNVEPGFTLIPVALCLNKEDSDMPTLAVFEISPNVTEWSQRIPLDLCPKDFVCRLADEVRRLEGEDE